MSDFLAEMEARRNRVETPGAPIAAVIIGFVVAFFAPLLELPITHADAVDLAAGELDFSLFAAKVLGLALATTAAIGGALWFFFIRRSRPGWILPVLAGLLVVTSVIGLGFSRGAGALAYQGQQEAIARAEIVKAMDQMLDNALDGATVDIRPKARGDAGKVERVVKETFAAMQTLGRAYAADINALDLEWKDTPSSLTQAALRKRVERLLAAKARTQAFRAAMRAEMRSMPDRFRKAGASASLQRSFMAGFETSIEGELASFDESLDVHVKTLDVHIAQTRFLMDRPNAWTVTRGGVTFYRVGDMQRFNAFADDLRRIQQAYEELQYQDRKKLVESRDRIAGEY